MKDKPSNPPAFPHLNPNFDNNWDKEPQREGMTLRDYFAAKAMQALISNPNEDQRDNEDLMAELAYTYADSMLKVRGD